jgi:hypothetical protein
LIGERAGCIYRCVLARSGKSAVAIQEAGEHEGDQVRDGFRLAICGAINPRAMSRPNPDGTITLVMSIADPGTYNWIDVGGLHDLLLFCRWQGLPKQTIGKGPKLRAEITKLSMLPDILLFATEFVTGQEREQQITTRAFAYDRRWANDK